MILTQILIYLNSKYMIKIKSNEKLIDRIISDGEMRTTLTKTSHPYFFAVYFSHYISYQSADYHKNLFDLTEDDSIKTSVILAFRGSGKSTIMTMSYPLWAILGKPQKKFIIIIGQTQRQARQHLDNIKHELERNQLLQNDLGPFKVEDTEWGAYSLVLPWYNARISAVSMEQSPRGLRHAEHRPDLIICDDIEDVNTVRTKESRDKIFDWITGEVIPAGDNNTKIIFVGNLLHEDSLIMRLITKTENNEFDAVIKRIPLLDENDKIAWTGKYPDMDAILTEKKKIGSESAFQREYLLRIIANEDRVIHREWIHYYDALPLEYPVAINVGVDLAISSKQSADYTAMVSAYVYGHRATSKIYILANPVNVRITFPQTLNQIRSMYRTYNSYCSCKFFIEDVGYQAAIIQQLKSEFLNVEESKVHGQDKYSRLAVISHLVQEGIILFPRKGAELLIQQLVNFGIEKHDDLADAFAIVVHKTIQKTFNRCRGFTRDQMDQMNIRF